jgi:hypothetical protein
MVSGRTDSSMLELFIFPKLNTDLGVPAVCLFGRKAVEAIGARNVIGI